MAEPLPKRTMNTPVVAHEPVQLRRFELPDITQHGPWVSERLLQSYPHLTQMTLYGWLNSLLNNNEFLFLYQPNAVALANVQRGNTLDPKPIVREYFVFVQNKDDATQVQNAVAFYEDFARWAKTLSADTILLSEMSDVPPEKIKITNGRRFENVQAFVKLT